MIEKAGNLSLYGAGAGNTVKPLLRKELESGLPVDGLALGSANAEVGVMPKRLLSAEGDVGVVNVAAGPFADDLKKVLEKLGVEVREFPSSSKGGGGLMHAKEVWIEDTEGFPTQLYPVHSAPRMNSPDINERAHSFTNLLFHNHGPLDVGMAAADMAKLTDETRQHLKDNQITLHVQEGPSVPDGQLHPMHTKYGITSDMPAEYNPVDGFKLPGLANRGDGADSGGLLGSPNFSSALSWANPEDASVDVHFSEENRRQFMELWKLAGDDK